MFWLLSDLVETSLAQWWWVCEVTSYLDFWPFFFPLKEKIHVISRSFLRLGSCSPWSFVYSASGISWNSSRAAQLITFAGIIFRYRFLVKIASQAQEGKALPVSLRYLSRRNEQCPVINGEGFLEPGVQRRIYQDRTGRWENLTVPTATPKKWFGKPVSRLTYSCVPLCGDPARCVKRPAFSSLRRCQVSVRSVAL